MYSILKQAKRTPRIPVPFTPNLLKPGFWAIDLETRGVDASDPQSEIVGIGLANDKYCFYIDLTDGKFVHTWRLLHLLKNSKLVAFNTMFDGAFLQKLTGKWLDFVGCSYGLFKQLSTEGFAGQSWSLETLQRDVLGWQISNKTALEIALKERKLGKADMWKLPSEILGPYCASDADAAWQGWQELVEQAKPFPQLLDYHQRIFLSNVKLLVEQQFKGIQIDQKLSKSCHEKLLNNIQAAMTSFLTYPQVAPHIEAYNKEVVDAWKASEPAQLTAKGEISKRWEAWLSSKTTLLAKRGFNPNSKSQLANLFYNNLGFVIKKRTTTGRAVVDRKILPSLGQPGKLLAEYNLLVKRRGYVERVIDKSARDSCLHPQFNSVGTVTTRLGGSGRLNLQQMPKVVDFLASFSARRGRKLNQADAEALEPTILAEFSQDKTLLSVYGPDAKQNDIYLVVLAKLGEFGKKVLVYYDPENPTPESIALAKKHCKRERSVAKTCYLAYIYGASVVRMHETLVLDGFDISLSEVRAIRNQLDVMFGGVRTFADTLEQMWHMNGGWIPSILGTPVCVDRKSLKDIVNRFCQTSGHLVLQLWIANIEKLRNERSVQMDPWLIDLHDETIWECSEFDTEAASCVICDALEATNNELGMSIKIKGPATVVDCLAAVKCENYQIWKEQQ